METVNNKGMVRVEERRNGRLMSRWTVSARVLALLVVTWSTNLGGGVSIAQETQFHPTAQSKIALVIEYAHGKFRLLIESHKVARDFKPIEWVEYLLFLDKTLFILQDPWAARIISDLSKLVASPPTKSKQLIYAFDPLFYSRLTSIEINTLFSKRGFYVLNTYFESDPEPLLPLSFKGPYYENSGIEKAVILYAEYWFVNLRGGTRDQFRSLLKRHLNVYQKTGYPREGSKVFRIPNLLLKQEPLHGSPKY